LLNANMPDVIKSDAREQTSGQNFVHSNSSCLEFNNDQIITTGL
jgi:hypothetical protein